MGYKLQKIIKFSICNSISDDMHTFELCRLFGRTVLVASKTSKRQEGICKCHHKGNSISFANSYFHERCRIVLEGPSLARHGEQKANCHKQHPTQPLWK